jgi:hypothetical protein
VGNGKVTGEEVRAYHEKQRGELTEREEREQPQIHSLIDTQTGEEVRTTLEPEFVAGLHEGRYKLPETERVWVVMPDGTKRHISGQLAHDVVRAGGQILDVTGERRAGHEETLERTYGDQPVLAAGLGLASGATLGLSDVAARALGQEEAVREVKERSPTAAAIGEVTGAVVPALVTGPSGMARAGGIGRALARTPAGRVAQLGEGVAARGAGRGFAARLGARAAGGAVEGALYGAGTGVSEIALSDDPVTAERVTSVLGSRALYGAALGAGVGAGMTVAGAAAQKGMKTGRKLVDDMGGKLGRSAPEELPAELTGYRAQFDEVNPWVIAPGGKEGIRKRMMDSKVRLRKLGDTPETLANRPGAMLEPLEREAVALREVAEQRGAIEKRLAAEDAGMLDDIATYRKQVAGPTAGDARVIEDATAWIDKSKGQDILINIADDSPLARRYAELFGELPSGKAGGKIIRPKQLRQIRDVIEEGSATPSTLWDDAPTISGKPARIPVDSPVAVRYKGHFGTPAAGKGGKKYLRLSLDELDELGGAIDRGEIQGARAKALAGLDDLIARNDALRESTKAAMNKGPTGLIGQVISMVPGLNRVSGLVSGRLAKAGVEASKRTGSAIDAIMKVGERAAPKVRPGATKVLQQVAFAPEPDKPREPAVPAASELHGAYRSRAEEIRSQTTPGPDGAPVVSDEARADIADRLKPMAALKPLMADRMESIAVRRLEYLASKLPPRPDVMALQMGPDRWVPSDMAMRSFARSVQAVEDPISVFERVADGSVTPEDAEALRAVYPELFQEAKDDIITRLPELRQQLPYERRLSLSILYGVPVDPSMAPGIVNVLQGNFGREVGTDGGITPPVAQPQFAAVSRPEPTPSQERAEG